MSTEYWKISKEEKLLKQQSRAYKSQLQRKLPKKTFMKQYTQLYKSSLFREMKQKETTAQLYIALYIM